MNGQTKEALQAAAAFTKRQLLASRRFAPQHKDVLAALLKQDRRYTIDQAQAVIDGFHQAESP